MRKRKRAGKKKDAMDFDDTDGIDLENSFSHAEPETATAAGTRLTNLLGRGAAADIEDDSGASDEDTAVVTGVPSTINACVTAEEFLSTHIIGKVAQKRGRKPKIVTGEVIFRNLDTPAIQEERDTVAAAFYADDNTVELPITELPPTEDPMEDTEEAPIEDMFDVADSTGEADTSEEVPLSGVGNAPVTDSDEGETYIDVPDGTAGTAETAEFDTGAEEEDAPKTWDEETVKKTDPKKVMGNESDKIEKRKILNAIVITFAAIAVLSTVLPMLIKPKTDAISRNSRLETPTVYDYEAMVSRRSSPSYDIETPGQDKTGPGDTEESDEEALSKLPPIDSRYGPVSAEREEASSLSEAPSATGSGGGGGSGYVKPDTRTDRLQSKSIPGIKGITPTQRTYATADAWGQEPYRTPQETAQQQLNNPYAQYGLPSKEDYTSQMLSLYGQQQRAPGAVGVGSAGGANNYFNQNDQSGKNQFYQQGRDGAGGGQWLGPNTLWQGTILEATLTSNINTDLPGDCTAIVTRNVYSSLDGRYMLIPQNSRLFGSYNSSISYSQSRIQVGWHTLIRPDGYMISLGNMNATDSQGASGLKGLINDHPFQYLKALGLMSAFRIVNAEFENTAATSNNQYVQNLMADSYSVTNTLGAKLIDRAMDVQPTITIKAGKKINVVANQTLLLPPLDPYDITQPYER